MMPHGAPGRGVHVCVCARVCACVCARACVRVCVRALRVRASQAHLRGGAAAQQEATNRQRATHPRPGFQPFGRAAPARAPPAPHPGQQPALPWRLPPLQLRRRRPCPLARLRGCVCAWLCACVCVVCLCVFCFFPCDWGDARETGREGKREGRRREREKGAGREEEAGARVGGLFFANPLARLRLPPSPRRRPHPVHHTRPPPTVTTSNNKTNNPTERHPSPPPSLPLLLPPPFPHSPPLSLTPRPPRGSRRTATARSRP